MNRPLTIARSLRGRFISYLDHASSLGGYAEPAGWLFCRRFAVGGGRPVGVLLQRFGLGEAFELLGGEAVGVVVMGVGVEVGELEGRVLVGG